MLTFIALTKAESSSLEVKTRFAYRPSKATSLLVNNQHLSLHPVKSMVESSS